MARLHCLGIACHGKTLVLAESLLPARAENSCRFSRGTNLAGQREKIKDQDPVVGDQLIMLVHDISIFSFSQLHFAILVFQPQVPRITTRIPWANWCIVCGNQNSKEVVLHYAQGLLTITRLSFRVKVDLSEVRRPKRKVKANTS